MSSDKTLIEQPYLPFSCHGVNEDGILSSSALFQQNQEQPSLGRQLLQLLLDELVPPAEETTSGLYEPQLLMAEDLTIPKLHNTSAPGLLPYYPPGSSLSSPRHESLCSWSTSASVINPEPFRSPISTSSTISGPPPGFAVDPFSNLNHCVDVSRIEKSYSSNDPWAVQHARPAPLRHVNPNVEKMCWTATDLCTEEAVLNMYLMNLLNSPQRF